MLLVVWRENSNTDVFDHMQLESDYLFQFFVCSKSCKLVCEYGEARTSRALNTLLLFREVADIAVGGVAVWEHCAISVVGENFEQSVAGRIESSGSDQSVHAGSV